jgi:hypothetical protein
MKNFSQEIVKRVGTPPGANMLITKEKGFHRVFHLVMVSSYWSVEAGKDRERIEKEEPSFH